MFGKPLVLNLLACLGVFVSRSQDILPFQESRFSWAAVEQRPTPEQLNTFLAQHRKDFPWFLDKPEKYDHRTVDSLKKRLHFIDLDRDHQPDVIFEGESGGEATMFTIYLNRSNTYKEVFSNEQGIIRMDWQDGRLHKLYIQDWGCCAENVNINKIFQLSYDAAGDPKFIQVYQGCSIKGTSLPDTLFEKAFRFEVINPAYNIRLAPVVDDASEQEWDVDGQPKHGNIIATLAQGATGTALAKKIDATGREWWFVEIDEEYYPASSYAFFNATHLEFPTKISGWISSRFVKPI